MEQEFGQLIRELRLKEGISQAELGRRAGVTQRSIEYYERTGRIPTLVVADRILQALNHQMMIGKSTEDKSA